jgi:D-amino-acid dehydrogenase
MRIVVLGAGIVGASAAYHLTRLGAEVYMIDRDAPGRSTFAGAGIICPWLSQVRDPRYEGLSFAAARYYPELVVELAAAGETETEYEVVGGLVVGDSALQLEAIVKRLQEYLDRGAKEIGDVRLLSSGESKRAVSLSRFGSGWRLSQRSRPRVGGNVSSGTVQSGY